MTTYTVPKRVDILKQKFSNSIGLPFKELLPETTIDEIIRELKIKYRCRLFTPIVTLWAFLSQVLDVATIQITFLATQPEYYQCLGIFLDVPRF